jgi:hypothetical protein
MTSGVVAVALLALRALTPALSSLSTGPLRYAASPCQREREPISPSHRGQNPSVSERETEYASPLPRTGEGVGG